MAGTNDLVRQMILAHSTQDDPTFRSVVEQYIAEARRKNHHLVAEELENILYNIPKSRSATWKRLGLSELDLPKDKDRGTFLVDVAIPKKELEDLILQDDVKSSLERIIDEQYRIDILATYGLRPISKVLFCGPPGCGKTVAAEGLAQALRLPFVTVRFDTVRACLGTHGIIDV